MYLVILLLPLLGAVISGLGGRWLGCWGSSIYSTTCVTISALLSFFSFYEVGLTGTSCYIELLPWIESGILKIHWGFFFDSITAVMLVVVTLVSSLVHLYSIKYMETDPHRPRYMSYLELFTFFMLILVTADNLLQMFLGWEGVGLASYLLISFWYTRLSANQSAIKALIVNRIGDFSLSLGILAAFSLFYSIDYSTIFTLAPILDDKFLVFMGFKLHGLTLISILFFIGAMGKSAQLGLHTWLPDAMEGPTPVSALIHAATMVTAGVFLMIRFSNLLEYSPTALCMLTFFGSLTAFFAGMVGVFQNDLKKVIAYSTCSQLGYMIFSCGLSSYDVSLFHLFNHAFFKALLFLSAGSVIHAVGNEQDMRRMGSLINYLPVTYSLMLIGSLALSGFPYLTGFYSKDFILELTQSTNSSNLVAASAVFASWLGNLSVIFTAFYSFRLIYLTFLNNFNSNRILAGSVHESSFLMIYPLVFLGVGSLFFGYLFKDLFIGLGSDFWNGSIFVLPNHNFFVEAEWLNLGVKWLPFFLSMFGLVAASLMNVREYFTLKPSRIFSFLAFLANKKWFWDVIYSKFLVVPALRLGYVTMFKTLDRGFVELSGPFGLSKLISSWSKLIIKIQTGQITHYIFFMVLGLSFFGMNLIYNGYSIIEVNFYLTSFFFILFFFI